MNYWIENALPLENNASTAVFPQTRYQGSKAKIIDWILDCTHGMKIHTLLDAFGGTGIVGYHFKQQGKNIVYNDLMKCNAMMAVALLENQGTYLEKREVEELLAEDVSADCPHFIEENYRGIFYLDEENRWLDEMVYKIRRMEDRYKRAIAWFALMQGCIIKRPYNLFHRANLSVRLSKVHRSFGNKTTWDTPFPKYFRQFVEEADRAVFLGAGRVRVLCGDALAIEPEKYDIDTVYIDTPYVSSKGVGTDYVDFYGFLEGMMEYDDWGKKILAQYRHKPLVGKGDKTWTGKNEIYESFERLFHHFRHQQIILSYREDGIPSVPELVRLLQKYHKHVSQVHAKEYQYVLSQRRTKEVLILAQ